MTRSVKSGLDVQAPSDGLIGLARGVIMTGSHRRGIELTRSLESVISAPPELQYAQQKLARVSESQVLASLVHPRKGADYLMLDIGSHRGESAKHFRKIGWSIHCIEDNLKLRKKLADSMANYDRAAVDYRFLAPEESPRTSGQKPEGGVYTSIAAILNERHKTRLDVLKIHGSGQELNTLRAVPWRSISVDFIECKFDNSRSETDALSGDRIATFLIERGYAVYVSEWHKVSRKTDPPSWYRVYRYPQDHFSHSASGQILAFRNDPGLEAVINAFKSNLTFQETRPSGQPKIAEQGHAPTPPIQTTPGLHPKSDPTEAEKPPITNYLAARFRRLLPIALLAVGFPIAAAFLLSDNTPAMTALLLLFVALAAPLGFVAMRAFFHITRLNQKLSQQSVQLEKAIALAGSQNRFKEAVNDVLSEDPVLNPARIESLSKSQRAMKRNLKNLEERYDSSNTLTNKVAKRLEQADQDHRATRIALETMSKQVDNLARTRNAQRAAEDRLASALSTIQDQLKDEYALAKDVGEIADAVQEFENKLLNTGHNLREGLAARLDELTGQIDGFSEQHSEMSTSLTSIQNEMTQTQSEFEKLELKLVDQKNALSHVSRWSSFDNKKWYQRFNRRLEKRHIEELRATWSDRLALSISQKTLGYMATRVETLESQMDGRLATSTQDMILRTLIARSVNSKTLDVLEIGTLFGIGAAIMFDHTVHHFDQVHYTLLDPLDGYYKSGQSDGPTDLPVTEFQLRRNMERVGCDRKQYTLVKHLSTEPEGLKGVANKQYDLLVIDGDHTYAGVKIDFVNFLQFVKVGGFVIFDDYASEDWPDVKEFVDREVEPMPNMAKVGSSWRTCVYRKTQETEIAESL